jgi:4-diphosphocytidyl-2-C-methyl-D-erythritol kinase
MEASTLKLPCPAKVNLALAIGPPLSNGYHPLASWMVAVHFADHLELAASADGQSRFELAFAPDAPVPAKVDWPLEKDLVFRAHQLLEGHVGRPLPVSVKLSKHIPAGAGLGGGSSDAAAVLVGVDRLFELQLGESVLMELGQKLGSDVGFLVGAIAGGKSSAIVTGLGEKLEPATLTEIIDLVLIFPPFGCPTGEVYRAFDQLHSPKPAAPADEPRVRALASTLPVPQAAPFNDLAEPACIARPELRKILTQLRDALQLPIHITGSGSTLFLLAPSSLTAKVLARKVTATTGLAAVATRTV